MEAVVEVQRQEEESLSVELIKQLLDEAGVSHGIDDALCAEFVDSVSKAPPGGRLRQAVARGTPAVNGDDGSIEMAVESDREDVGVARESGSIDYHERGSFTPIEKEQLIARVVPPTEGTPGKNVRGEELHAEPGKKASLNSGSGPALTAGGTELRAIRAGDLRFVGDRIEVSELIRVLGNLDFQMGSVECEGSVTVEGDVLPGFHIRAEGDVSVGGVVDSAEVKAAGTVTVRQGVIRGGRVSAGGELKVGYVTGSYLESDASVTILKEAVHSTVVSGDSIVVPGSGRVVGGSLQAKKRIEVGEAGHENESATTLIAAGATPLKDLEEAKLKAQIKRTAAVKAQIGKIKELAQPDQHGRLDQLAASHEASEEKSAEALAELEKESDGLSECRIIVSRAVHSGVRIRIGPGELAIVEGHRSAKFQYYKDAGEVIGVYSGG